MLSAFGKAQPLQRAQSMGHPGSMLASKGAPPASHKSWVAHPFALFAKGWDSREPPSRFPQPNVTANLDPGIQIADHCLGGGGARRNREPGHNSFVLKILTSNPLGLKILQTMFANPAPVAAFKGVGGGGYPLKPAVFPKRTRRKSAHQRFSSEIFSAGFVTMKAASVSPK